MSTGFATEIDPNAAKGAEEAAAGGNGDFKPLPGGKYQATVAQIKGVAEFGGTGGNAKKKVVNIGFRVVDESPTGKGRFVWARIPLFSRFAPNEKHPEGAVNRGFWDFWEKAMGVSRDHILSGQPLPSDIAGRRLTITLSAPIAPDNYNPLGSNEISFYDAAGDINLTPLGPVRVPWLDENGHLIVGAAQAPGAPAQAAPGAQQAWTAPPAPGAPQAPAAPVAPPAPAAVAPAAPQAPAQAAQAEQWQPNPADVAYAGAAAGAPSGF